MVIEKVHLTNPVEQANGRLAATVLLEHQAGTLTLSAVVDQPSIADPALIDQRLAAEAIRQLRRMPEYRKDASLVTILDSAWPIPAAS